MMRRWMAVALIAGWLGQGAVARAQYLATPVGPARIPEPVPEACPPPNLTPGPLTPLQAPPGPPDIFSLPASHNNAFPNEEFGVECAWFAGLGSQALMRQHLGKGAVAVLDPQRLDTGAIPPANAAVLQSFDNLRPDMNFGPKATVGYIWCNQVIELTGYYIPQNVSRVDTVMPGQVDSFFNNPPLGFEGDNGLWLQADRIRTSLYSAIGNAELNYRYTNTAVTECELILGIRYFDLMETLEIFTDDDGITFPLNNGQPDPTRQATYATRTHNRIVAPQIGFEYNKAVCSWLTLGVTGKVALGADFAEVQNSLVRGDGFTGFNFKRNETIFSQIYDINAFVEFHITERARLRGGYTALWLVDLAVSQDQVDYNLANPSGMRNNSGSIFFHGPMVEMQFLF